MTLDRHSDSPHCDRCGRSVPTTYAPEYGANFCEPCAADPQADPREKGCSRYRTIVADPPWDHSDGTGVNLHGDEASRPGLPYQTMSVEEIKALPVAA